MTNADKWFLGLNTVRSVTPVQAPVLMYERVRMISDEQTMHYRQLTMDCASSKDYSLILETGLASMEAQCFSYLDWWSLYTLQTCL